MTVKTSRLNAIAGGILKRRDDWLPAMALLLCLIMFAMAALTLVGANSDPVTGQKANVTGVSAQGYQGLKRLLEARGHSVMLNRDADAVSRTRADLEIITLDSDLQNFLFGFDPNASAHSKAKDAGGSQHSADSTSSGASDAGVSSSASISSSLDDVNDDDLHTAGVADPEKVQHLLYHPLGRVVLVVMPKWDAGQMAKHPNWDVDPQMVSEQVELTTLGLLSPVTSRPVPFPVPDHIKITPPPGQGVVISQRRALVFDLPQASLQRDVRPKTAAEKKADDAARKAQPLNPALAVAGLTYVPIKRPWRLAAQNGYPALDLGVIAGLQSFRAPNLQPVLTTIDGRPILSRVIVTGNRRPPAAPVYLLSDPDLLNNQILSDPKRVAAALNLIDALSPTRSGAPASVVFNLTYNGLGFDHDLLHMIARPPYVAVPLCLLLTGLALMWSAFSRFGPPAVAPEEAPLGRGVRLLADNAARLMSLTLKEAKLAPTYAQHIRDMVLKARGYMQAGYSESPDDLADRIGRAHATTDTYLDLKAQADKALTVHQLIDITRRLYAWKTEIERAHI